MCSLILPNYLAEFLLRRNKRLEEEIISKFSMPVIQGLHNKMPTNFYFDNFAHTYQQNLIEDLIIESIKICPHNF